MEKDTEEEVTYTPSKWLIKRWREICGEEENEKYYLDKTHVLGIPKSFNKRHYLKLGDVKIVNRPREKEATILLAKKYGVGASELFLAMYILRRRKYVTLGVYLERPKNLAELFVVSSRGEYIVIAPTIYPVYYWPCIKIEEIVEKVPKTLRVWQMMRNLERSEEG